ncbi:hypothetical protein B566_EDAN013875 [Ephemera danica]|nr:hypothetical protein B566_EDAN013875 [Ephemera danica]
MKISSLHIPYPQFWTVLRAAGNQISAVRTPGQIRHTIRVPVQCLAENTFEEPFSWLEEAACCCWSVAPFCSTEPFAACCIVASSKVRCFLRGGGASPPSSDSPLEARLAKASP